MVLLRGTMETRRRIATGRPVNLMKITHAFITLMLIGSSMIMRVVGNFSTLARKQPVAYLFLSCILT